MCTQAWVFLSSLLAEFVSVAVALVFISNGIISLAFYHKNWYDNNLDPFMASVYSTIVPIICLKSLRSSTSHERMDKLTPAIKRLFLLKTTIGYCILLPFVGTTYHLVYHSGMNHSSDLLLRRESMNVFMGGTVGLGLISLLLGVAAMKPLRFSLSVPRYCRYVLKVGLASACCTPALALFSWQFLHQGQETPLKFGIESVCGSKIDQPLYFNGFSRNLGENEQGRKHFNFCQKNSGFLGKFQNLI